MGIPMVLGSYVVRGASLPCPPFARVQIRCYDPTPFHRISIRSIASVGHNRLIFSLVPSCRLAFHASERIWAKQMILPCHTCIK